MTSAQIFVAVLGASGYTFVHDSRHYTTSYDRFNKNHVFLLFFQLKSIVQKKLK